MASPLIHQRGRVIGKWAQRCPCRWSAILSATPPPAAQTRQRHPGEGEVHPNVESKLESRGTLHLKNMQMCKQLYEILAHI